MGKVSDLAQELRNHAVDQGPLSGKDPMADQHRSMQL